MPTSLYLSVPGGGKTTLMRSHVAALAAAEDAPVFLVVDHDDSWGEFVLTHGGRVFLSAGEWWAEPCALAAFRGVPASDVAQLAIDVGWSVYVDDECDDALSGWRASPLREIVKRGRHLKNRAGLVTSVSAMLATHRPANLPTDVLGCFSRVYVGRLQSWTDADRVFREGWLPGARSALEARGELDARAPGEFSVWPA